MSAICLVLATHVAYEGPQHLVHRFGKDAHCGFLTAYVAKCGAWCPGGWTLLGGLSDVTCSECKSPGGL